jgi:hypothetical protein
MYATVHRRRGHYSKHKFQSHVCNRKHNAINAFYTYIIVICLSLLRLALKCTCSLVVLASLHDLHIHRVTICDCHNIIIQIPSFLTLFYSVMSTCFKTHACQFFSEWSMINDPLLPGLQSID